MINNITAARGIITKCIEPNDIHLYRFGKYYKSSNGKKISIKTVSDRGSDHIWVDVAINHLKDVDFVIFGWFNNKEIYECSYVIPSDFLRGKLEQHGKKNKAGKRYHFNIKVRDVLHLDKKNTCSIKEYKNNFSILK